MTMERLSQAAPRALTGLAILLLSVGVFLAPAPDASAAIVPPANRCDGNACVDCAFDLNTQMCSGWCNTPANAVCNGCACKFYQDPKNPNIQQCYCLK